MNKIGIIIQREFLSRTRKRTFLLTTILLPILVVGFYGAVIFFSVKGESLKEVAVIDAANLFNGRLEDGEVTKFHLIKDADAAAFKSEFIRQGYQFLVTIPANLDIENPGGIIIYGQEQAGIGLEEQIRSRVNKAVESKLIQKNFGDAISIDAINKIKSNAEIKSLSLKDGMEKEGNAAVATGVALMTGLLVYFVLMIYGSMVMRGVMEEKTNRIAEVMVSSVKPFQLMMGKILGIGAVGLFQFFIWGVLIVILFALLPVLFPGPADAMAAAAAPQMATLPNAEHLNKAGAMNNILSNLHHLNIPLLISGFFIYFLGGYFMYAALFAAVGSAVNEDPQDAQQLMIPIMMPIIFSFVMLSKVVQDPHSTLAVFGSLFPLTSPILMPARMAFDVPVWEIILSVVLLIGGFTLTTWLAAKIYRTGILLYGKKVTWKEMIKWIVRK